MSLQLVDVLVLQDKARIRQLQKQPVLWTFHGPSLGAHPLAFMWANL